MYMNWWAFSIQGHVGDRKWVLLMKAFHTRCVLVISFPCATCMPVKCKKARKGQRKLGILKCYLNLSCDMCTKIMNI